jgi:hypothetical protein
MGAVKINGTTSGSVSLTAPTSGSDVTLTLPGVTGELLPLAGGKILQIVRATDSTDRTTTSTSFVDVTGMSVTITPQKSDSAVLVLGIFGSFNTGTTFALAQFRLTDSSNNALSGAENCDSGLLATTQSAIPVTIIGRSTPATTSATTYKLRFKVSSGHGATAQVSGSVLTSQLYAIEVSA